MCAWPGGKATKAQHILCVLNDPIWNGYHYYEPMCGMCHILRRVTNKASYTASDNNALLIHLLRSVKTGCAIPHITRERYYELKSETQVTLERAVASHTFSYQGKFFGGYTHTYNRPNGKQDDMSESRRRYYRQLEANDTFQKTDLRCCDYNELQPTGALVLFDPPYYGTTNGYGSQFDTPAFWEVASKLSNDNIVFVCEYTAPASWSCIASCEKMCSLAGGHRQSVRRERLWVHDTALARIRCMSGGEALFPSNGALSKDRLNSIDDVGM